MRSLNTPRIFIFSAERAELDETENRTRTEQLHFALEQAGIPFQLADGVYKSVREDAFIVSGARHQEQVYALADEFHQESVLVVAENDRTAYLADPETGSLKHLGVLVEVTKDESYSVDHTAVGLPEKYYAVRETSGPDLPEGI